MEFDPTEDHRFKKRRAVHSLDGLEVLELDKDVRFKEILLPLKSPGVELIEDDQDQRGNNVTV